ncbi:hypothetical protein F0U44_13645 [Nocardioides humilatus]|uniref:Uncharacterized protein n=1 Tax=Nocardioides humilatus TaxID=2607660 RepID=A0A5B1LGW9_9ACTN|nr:hypothetical protein [Nocardioides humilatus]KAA1419468.1 hypothetical protein F0U44_13645 [Nocardioides humilatus]
MLMQVTLKHSIAAGATVLAVLIAAPAIGAASGSDPSGQPPPGTKGTVATSHFAPTPKQPPAGIKGHVAKGHFAPTPKQPVNKHPQKSTGIKLGKQLRHSKHDKGVKGLRPTKDHGKKNLPIQKG